MISPHRREIIPPILGGSVVHFPNPSLGGFTPDELFHLLYREVPWEQRNITIYGKDIPQPRLIKWYSPYSYTYSGLSLEPLPIPSPIETVMQAMTELTGAEFNGVLLNLYRDGKDSIGMHSDDEPEFGRNPTIASLSLGAERQFDFEHRFKRFPKASLPLTHGSVVVMSGETQDNWKHGVPKTTKPVGPRINLTFRNIVNPR